MAWLLVLIVILSISTLFFWACAEDQRTNSMQWQEAYDTASKRADHAESDLADMTEDRNHYNTEASKAAVESTRRGESIAELRKINRQFSEALQDAQKTIEIVRKQVA